jgi:DNA topoisomerase-3
VDILSDDEGAVFLLEFIHAFTLNYSADMDIEISPPKQSRSTAKPKSKRPIPAQEPIASGSKTPMCRCDVPAAERTVVKVDSENKGRKFYRCGTEKNCQFFEWVDEPGKSSTVPAKRSHSVCRFLLSCY